MAFFTRVLVRTSSLLLALYTTSRIRALRVHTARRPKKAKRARHAGRGGVRRFENRTGAVAGEGSTTLRVRSPAKVACCCGSRSENMRQNCTAAPWKHATKPTKGAATFGARATHIGLPVSGQTAGVRKRLNCRREKKMYSCRSRYIYATCLSKDRDMW